MRRGWLIVGLVIGLAVSGAGCAAAPAAGSAEGAWTSAPRTPAPGLTAALSAARPPQAGQQSLELFITDDAQKPVTDAQVTFDLDMTNMSMGQSVIAAAGDGQGHYAAPVTFSMPGPWRLIATLERPGRPPAVVRFDFDVAPK